MRVYYMTSVKWGNVILRERRLKLAPFDELNDRFELSLIDARARETRKFAKLVTDHFRNTVGVTCFGAHWASPVMWAHYADRHFGVTLGFDVPAALLTKIRYTDKKISVPFGSHLPMHGLSEGLLDKIRMTKATDWSYEREYRVESELTDQDPIAGFYHVDFGAQVTLREVIIGHPCIWTVATIHTMFRASVQSVRICKARPAFGKFEMAEDTQVKAVNV